MALITWSDRLSVGVDLFDSEHKKLVELLNNLHDAMKQGKARHQIGEFLDELIRYTELHFKSEEKAMVQAGYPKYLSHKQEHEKLVLEVMDFRRKYASGEVGLTIELLTFLKEWLQNHILGTDKEYGEFFRDKRVK